MIGPNVMATPSAAIPPRLSPDLARILDRAQEGRELSRAEGLRLAEAEPDAVAAIAAAADAVRRRRVGDLVTYVVNRNINFTNVCKIGCRFCAFSVAPDAPEAFSLPLEEIAARAREARARGATEVCVQGGLPPDLDGFHYRNILRAIKGAAPELHIHAFSPMEVVYGAAQTGLRLRDYLSLLRDEGLGSLPGTAAEILDDEIRHVLSHDKVSVAQWVEVITTAHRLGIPTSSTMMYGHVEQPAHWVGQLCLLREIQRATGGFTEFVPLGFIHPQTSIFRDGQARPGAEASDHVKVHALARLMLQGLIDNIQVSWVKLDCALAQRCLQAGGNDYSGTLMEENISRSAGATTGEYLPPEEFHRRIRELGRIPAQRTTTYELVEVFSGESENTKRKT